MMVVVAVLMMMMLADDGDDDDVDDDDVDDVDDHHRSCILRRDRNTNSVAILFHGRAWQFGLSKSKCVRCCRGWVDGHGVGLPHIAPSNSQSLM